MLNWFFQSLRSNHLFYQFLKSSSSQITKRRFIHSKGRVLSTSVVAHFQHTFPRCHHRSNSSLRISLRRGAGNVLLRMSARTNRTSIVHLVHFLLTSILNKLESHRYMLIPVCAVFSLNQSYRSLIIQVHHHWLATRNSNSPSKYSIQSEQITCHH